MHRDEIGAEILLTGNTLLAKLRRDDRHLVLPYISRVRVVPGETLLRAGEAIDRLYYPETAILAIIEEDLHGRVIETGLVGREGFVGWPALMGCRRTTARAEVLLTGGTVLQIDARRIQAACHASATLRDTMLGFVEDMIVQMASSMLANMSYPLISRIARWLLMRHDRMSDNVLGVRHDEISAAMGVRRASVTDCLHLLEGELLVRCHRGKIRICNRRGLEERAGASYGKAEAHHRSLFGSISDPLHSRQDYLDCIAGSRFSALHNPRPATPLQPWALSKELPSLA